MIQAAGQLARIFVSHSHDDIAWCRDFVNALRSSGADVWYDEHNLGYGTLGSVIEQEMRARHIFIVVLSPAAVESRWVQREVDAAIRLQDQEHDRIILPVIAAKCDIPIFWGGYKRVSGPGDTSLLASEAARRSVHSLGIVQPSSPPVRAATEKILPTDEGTAPRPQQSIVSPQRAVAAVVTAPTETSGDEYQLDITDLYDERRRRFAVHFPSWLLIAAILSGLLAFLITGFFGFRDPLEPQLTATIFKEPWTLYLWLSGLAIALQWAVLRHRSLRPQRAAAVGVTTICVVLVGIVYFFNRDALPLNQSGLRLSEIERSATTYAVINFGILGLYWLSSIGRWLRAGQDRLIRIGIDLVVGAFLVFLLSFLFQALVINDLFSLLQVNNQIDTCTVSFPGGTCISPGGGIVNPPTLTFLDSIMALACLPLGLLIIIMSILIRYLSSNGGISRAADVHHSAAQPFIQALRTTFDFHQGMPSWLLSGFRRVAWPALILLGTIAAAAAARNIQVYLHLLSDQRACLAAGFADAQRACGGADTYTLVQGEINNFEQYQAVGLALLWGVIAILAITMGLAFILSRRRVMSNTLRFLGRMGLVMLPVFWVFSLALSGFNGLFSLTHLSDRVPFPQPELFTMISLGWGVLWLIARAIRRPAARQATAMPVSARVDRR